MTRTRNRLAIEHPPLEHLPPRPRLLPPTLRLAPELAVLAVLDDALRSALIALVAAHPTLDEHDGVLQPPSLRRARRFARHALDLRDSLDAYRDAVLAPLGPIPLPDDDIPF